MSPCGEGAGANTERGAGSCAGERAAAVVPLCVLVAPGARRQPICAHGMEDPRRFFQRRDSVNRIAFTRVEVSQSVTIRLTSISLSPIRLGRRVPFRATTRVSPKRTGLTPNAPLQEAIIRMK
jgi:hypothetical protein